MRLTPWRCDLLPLFLYAAKVGSSSWCPILYKPGSSSFDRLPTKLLGVEVWTNNKDEITTIKSWFLFGENALPWVSGDLHPTGKPNLVSDLLEEENTQMGCVELGHKDDGSIVSLAFCVHHNGPNRDSSVCQPVGPIGDPNQADKLKLTCMVHHQTPNEATIQQTIQVFADIPHSDCNSLPDHSVVGKNNLPFERPGMFPHIFPGINSTNVRPRDSGTESPSPSSSPSTISPTTTTTTTTTTAVSSSPSSSPSSSNNTSTTVDQLEGINIPVTHNGTLFSIRQGSNCVLRYNTTPFAVGCNLKILIQTSSSPMAVTIETVALLLNPDDSQDGTILAIDMAFLQSHEEQPFFANVSNWTFAFETTRVFSVTQDELADGMCNYSLLQSVCGSICFEANIDWNEDGSGLEASLMLKVTMLDDPSTNNQYDNDDNNSNNNCQGKMDQLGTTEPIEWDTNFGELIHDSVTAGRSASRPFPTVSRGVPLGDGLVDENGIFRLGLTSLPPEPLTIPPPEKTLELDNYTYSLDGTPFQVSLINTECGIVAETPPWSVDCKATVQLNHGAQALNNGEALELQLFAAGVLDTHLDSDFMIPLNYGFHIPQTTIQMSEGQPPLSFGPLSYPGEGKGYFMALMKDDVEDVGVCLSNLADYFGAVSEASLDADKLSLAAAVGGVDVCFKLQGSSGLVAGSTGAQLRFVMTTTMLDPRVSQTVPLQDELLGQAQTILGLGEPLFFELDLGRLLNRSIVRKRNLRQGRDLLVDDGAFFTQDGAFNLGTRLGQDAVRPDDFSMPTTNPISQAETPSPTSNSQPSQPEALSPPANPGIVTLIPLDAETPAPLTSTGLENFETLPPRPKEGSTKGLPTARVVTPNPGHPRQNKWYGLIGSSGGRAPLVGSTLLGLASALYQLFW